MLEKKNILNINVSLNFHVVQFRGMLKYIKHKIVIFCDKIKFSKYINVESRY